MTFLLDANALIAMCFPEHIHNSAARSFLDGNSSFAVCPITEGALVRFILRSYPRGAAIAKSALEILSQFEGYEFWPDDISYSTTNWTLILGHKQVTDAYLVALAQAHGGRLATFDRSLAMTHDNVALIYPMDDSLT